MADLQCLKIKLKQGQTDKMVDFLRNLPNRADEVQESLRMEGVILETLFLEKTPDTDYLFFYTRAENLQRASEALMKSELPLDRETKALIQETWESAQPLELILDLERQA